MWNSVQIFSKFQTLLPSRDVLKFCLSKIFSEPFKCAHFLYMLIENEPDGHILKKNYALPHKYQGFFCILLFRSSSLENRISVFSRLQRLHLPVDGLYVGDAAILDQDNLNSVPLSTRFQIHFDNSVLFSSFLSRIED